MEKAIKLPLLSPQSGRAEGWMCVLLWFEYLQETGRVFCTPSDSGNGVVVGCLYFICTFTCMEYIYINLFSLYSGLFFNTVMQHHTNFL